MDVPPSPVGIHSHPCFSLLADALLVDMLELLGDAIQWFNEVVSDFRKTAVHQPGLKQYINNTVSSMRQEWWPGLQALEALENTLTTKDGKEGAMLACVPWLFLGLKILKLDEDEERERHEREAPRRCSRGACVYHRRVPKKGDRIEMKTCKGCGEVRYCGRDCQTKYVV